MRLFVSSLILLLLVVQLRSRDGGPPPCVCVCGGSISCPRNTTAYCECNESKHCSGICLGTAATPIRQTAVVLTYITRERVTEETLRETPQRYVPILDKFLESRIADGVYRMNYQDRVIGFTFTEKTLGDLKTAYAQLRR